MRCWVPLAGLLFLVGCGGDRVVSPEPIPPIPQLPTPPPPPRLKPLHVEGNRFVDSDGKTVYLQGVSYIPPDSKAYGWPARITRDILKKVADAGGNFVAVRLGPFIVQQEGADQVGYKMVGDKVDLDEWNPVFWSDLERFLGEAEALGIYVELDVIDGWTLKYGLSPWARAYNVNGVDEGDCSIYARGPEYRQGQWINKVGEHTGRFNNVLYQIGNENSVGSCGNYLSDAWEIGVYNHLKKNLAFRGFNRPVGTNSERGDLESRVDYIQRHSCEAQRPGSKPTGVNEWNCAPMSAEQYCIILGQAKAQGSWFLLWGDNMSPTVWEEALKCWSK